MLFSVFLEFGVRVTFGPAPAPAAPIRNPGAPSMLLGCSTRLFSPSHSILLDGKQSKRGSSGISNHIQRQGVGHPQQHVTCPPPPLAGIELGLLGI